MLRCSTGEEVQLDAAARLHKKCGPVGPISAFCISDRVPLGDPPRAGFSETLPDRQRFGVFTRHTEEAEFNIRNIHVPKGRVRDQSRDRTVRPGVFGLFFSVGAIYLPVAFELANQRGGSLAAAVAAVHSRGCRATGLLLVALRLLLPHRIASGSRPKKVSHVGVLCKSPRRISSGGSLSEALRDPFLPGRR